MLLGQRGDLTTPDSAKPVVQARRFEPLAESLQAAYQQTQRKVLEWRLLPFRDESCIAFVEGVEQFRHVLVRGPLLEAELPEPPESAPEDGSISR